MGPSNLLLMFGARPAPISPGQCSTGGVRYSPARSAIAPAPEVEQHISAESRRRCRSSAMVIEIITVGYEILDGDVLDTNSNWLAIQISRAGHRLARITVVEDLVPVVAECLKDSLGRSPHMILVCGGLGPTKDDLTLEGVALGLGRGLVENEQAMAMIQKRYARMHPEAPLDQLMTEARRKMGRLPEGATPLNNPAGTAPGVLIKVGKTTIICLPGVPDELRAIFTESVLPRLGKGEAAEVRTVIVVGIGESLLAPHLNRVMDEMGVEIRSYPSKGLIRLKILGSKAGKAAGRLKELLGRNVAVTEQDSR